ncbi:hypothetical protein CRG98_032677 [Punica granatum]|uniref:Secreted protein n=1 Tax=Punica granatum TaxID=22663 RepID=A0A2I0ITX1_PUNGR|nr:hypothetical protein CRG98_032677 [Punica granatum]
MASLVLLLSELLQPHSSSLAFLSSQPFPPPPPPSSSPLSASCSSSSNSWSSGARMARCVEGNDAEEAETAVVEDILEPRISVDLIWP